MLGAGRFGGAGFRKTTHDGKQIVHEALLIRMDPDDLDDEKLD